MKINRWSQTAKPETEALRKQLKSEGYEVSEWSDAPGTRHEPHAHETEQSHWLLSGELEFEVAGEVYTLQAGDRDFLPANTEHAAFVPGKEPARYLIGKKAQ
jgi:quercetin dioxygenase-like cupin family protein